MSKYDDIKIPSNLDDITKIAIDKADGYKKINISKKHKNKFISHKPYKVAMIIVSIGILTLTSSYALEKIIDYFNINTNSIYIHDKEDMTKFGKDLNLSSKDKGIELTVTNISIDENYMNIFYTVRSDKNIKSINKDYKNPYLANPILGIYMNDKNITPDGFIEHEASFVSDTQLKGIRKIDVSNLNLKDGNNIQIKVGEIFGIKGNWSVETYIDKSVTSSETKTYSINKKSKLMVPYDYNDKKINVKYDINIKEVVLSPFANKIILETKSNKSFDDWNPSLGASFALFDENNKALPIVETTKTEYTDTGATRTFNEFITGDNSPSSLSLVPITFDYTIQNYMLEPQSLRNNPLTFNTSEYGKLVLDEVITKENQLIYTYHKEGVVPYLPNFWFFDKEGNELEISGAVTESFDRKTGKMTVTKTLLHKFENLNKITKVSTYSDSDMKLLFDEKIKFDLKN